MPFLHEMGLVVECSDRLAPTRAAVLAFGRPRYVRQVLPRPVIDCQFIGVAYRRGRPRGSARRFAREIAYLIANDKAKPHDVRPTEVLTCSNPQ